MAVGTYTLYIYIFIITQFYSQELKFFTQWQWISKSWWSNRLTVIQQSHGPQKIAVPSLRLALDGITFPSHSDPQSHPEKDVFKKTRCSPRTRMLTRMLMVQMSKHMDLQSRRTLFCNSLVEQACTYFPCYQSAVWSVECRVWSVKCRVWSVKCGVWSVKCRVWSVGGKCRV